MVIEALFYICLAMISLWIVSIFSRKISSSGRRLYSRTEMLSLSSQCTTTPSDWVSIQDIRKKYHEPRTTKFKAGKLRVKSLTKGRTLLLPIEDIENSTGFENLHTRESTCHSSPVKSYKNAGLSSKSLEEEVSFAVQSGDLYRAAMILNQMDTQGIEVKRNLLDSFLSLHNSKRVPFTTMNPNVQEFVPGFSKLNPEVQEFRPYELNPNAADFAPISYDI
jgi:hypothetical protein